MKARMDLNKEKCTGCYACHTACLDAHYEADAKHCYSRRVTVMYSRGDWQKNICPGCTHCGSCAAVCPAGAIYRDEKTGVILADGEKCTGCQKCHAVCPEQVIQYDQNGRIIKCDGCIERLREKREPACQRVCPAAAIDFQTDK